MNTAVFPDLTDRFPRGFTYHIEQQDLEQRERAVWQFQYYTRYATALNSGSIFDYRKYAAKYLNESGELLDCLEDVSSHEQAALNKFREAEQADLKSISPNLAKTSDEVDTE